MKFLNSSFDAFERCVCINLLEREDRFESAKRQFQKVGLGRVEFHRVQRSPNGGRLGCYQSHHEVIRQAYEDNLNNVLIFEDDVVFGEGWQEVVESCSDFVRSGHSYDSLFLGCELLFVDERTFPEIWRVKCLNNHAYVVSRAGMEKFLERHHVLGSSVVDHPHDLLQNSTWSQIYAHRKNLVIKQAVEFGTDNQWLDTIPSRYTAWFQSIVIRRYRKLSQQLVRNSTWARMRGNRVIGFGDYIIDDGRLRLRGSELLDIIALATISLMSKPPHGFLDWLNVISQNLANRIELVEEKASS